MSQAASTTLFTYDANGNTTSDGTNMYERDAVNRLLAVKQGSTTLASFLYDGEGRRSSQTAGGITTTHTYDGAQFFEERPTGGATKRFIYGPGVDHPLAQIVSGITSYFVGNHLGSIVRVTDSLANPFVTRQYDPWGRLLQASTTNGYAFTGREWHSEAHLYYYRARYYDPATARFLSEDPSRSDPGLASYAYTRNNPVIRTDPSGLKCEVRCRAVEGAEGIVVDFQNGGGGTIAAAWATGGWAASRLGAKHCFIACSEGGATTIMSLLFDKKAHMEDQATGTNNDVLYSRRGDYQAYPVDADCSCSCVKSTTGGLVATRWRMTNVFFLGPHSNSFANKLLHTCGMRARQNLGRVGATGWEAWGNVQF